MLIGAGGLGSAILELLARESPCRIVVCSRNAERGAARCNLARLGAMAQGYGPTIDFLPLDLNEQTATAETVRHISPDVILTTATMQTWWLTDLLPPQAAAIKDAPFGMWLPVHLTLTLKLMEALHMAGYSGKTLTAPFPDVVNPILARLGLAPTSGVGNLDEIVPKVRLLAAERLGASPEAVRVRLVAHHALEPAAFGHPVEEVPPHLLRIEYDAADVTARVGGERLLLAPYPLPSGPPTHFLTAGSAVRLVRALLWDRGTFLHVPGPCGLPGGYPAIAGREGVTPVPIEGHTIEEAIAVNERSHRFDGIERIEEDGTAVFCPSLVERVRDALGYECERLPPGEAEARAEELIERFRAYAARYGVTLPH